MKLTPENNSRRFFEPVMGFLLLLLLLFGLYSVLNVFFGVFTYAIIFSVSFFSTFEWLCRKLNNKRKLAAAIYAIILLGILAVPFTYLISELINYVNITADWIENAKVNGYPPLPEKLTTLPVVGKDIQEFWSAVQADPENTRAMYEKQIQSLLQQLIASGKGVIGTTLEFVVGIIISSLLLAQGEKILDPIILTAKRITGEENGPALINASGRAIKGVAVGVMGTAFIEALFAWIGFAITGSSLAVGLAALVFLFALIQLGPLLVVAPAAIWFALQGETGWAIFIGIYGLVVLVGIDNVLKPILIGRSGKLPVLVLFLGVIGGMVAWGFTGMFKGAIILALFYTIFRNWSAKNMTEQPA